MWNKCQYLNFRRLIRNFYQFSPKSEFIFNTKEPIEEVTKITRAPKAQQSLPCVIFGELVIIIAMLFFLPRD